MKRTGIKRRTPLKRSRPGKVLVQLKRTRIKPRCDRRQADEKKYEAAKAAHFREHPGCQMPGCSRSLLKGDVIDLHHKAGRSGPLLYHRPYFASLCRRHHDHVHAWLKESRANGWIIDLTRDQVFQIRQAEILG